MTSLLTNAAAQTALRALTMTNNFLEAAKDRISRGFRVSTAAEDAAYWSVATTMRSDNTSLSAVEGAPGLGWATINVPYTAVYQAIDMMREFRKKPVAARTVTDDRAKIPGEIDPAGAGIGLSGLSDSSIAPSIVQLVDAGMNEESTKLQALQVQAQLGIQALSIANASSRSILALFR